MSTQAFIKIDNEYELEEKMIRINYDAIPELVVPKIKKGIHHIDSIFQDLVEEFNNGNINEDIFEIIGTSIEQPTNYIYLIEIREGEVFLRVQEEYWIEQSEEFNEIPSHYLSSEMRTISVEQIY